MVRRVRGLHPTSGSSQAPVTPTSGIPHHFPTWTHHTAHVQVGSQLEGVSSLFSTMWALGTELSSSHLVAICMPLILGI